MFIAIVVVAVPMLFGYGFEVVQVVLCCKREKNNLGSLLCSSLTGKSSFVRLVRLGAAIQQQPAFLCTLRDKKEAEKKFPESLSLSWEEKGSKKYQFTMA